MNDGTDEPDADLEMVETRWEGVDSWTGPVEVAISRSSTGDAILTLPGSIAGVRADGTGTGIIVPLALMRWVVAESARMQSQANHSSS